MTTLSSTWEPPLTIPQSTNNPILPAADHSVVPIPGAINAKFNEADSKAEIIKSIALTSLKELAISLAFAGVTCLFVATPMGMVTLLVSAVAVVGINTLIRCGIGKLIHDTRILKQTDVNDAQVKLNEKFISFFQYLAPSTFSLIDNSTREVLVHEGGHALAATLLYENSRPTVEVTPFEGGVTRITSQILTPLGNAIGKENARFVFAGAGTAASILFSTVNLGVAHLLKNKCPELSRYLNVMAIIGIAQHVFYAISAFWASAGTGHDFLALWLGGINPVVSVVAIVALPILVKSAFFAYDYIHGKINPPLAAV